MLYFFEVYFQFGVCCAATGAVVGAIDYCSAKSRHRKSLRVLACRALSFGAAAAVAPVVAADAVASAVCLALFPESERAGTISAAINRLNSSIGDFLEYHVNRNIKPMYGTPISATQSSPQLANVHLPFLSSLRAHDVPAAAPAAEEDAKTNEEAAEEKQERARSSCTIEESVAPESPITAQ